MVGELNVCSFKLLKSSNEIVVFDGKGIHLLTTVVQFGSEGGNGSIKMANLISQSNIVLFKLRASGLRSIQCIGEV